MAQDRKQLTMDDCLLVCRLLSTKESAMRGFIWLVKEIAIFFIFALPYLALPAPPNDTHLPYPACPCDSTHLPTLSLQFTFDYKAEDPKNSLHLVFKRRTECMPPPPQVHIFYNREAFRLGSVLFSIESSSC